MASFTQPGCAKNLDEDEPFDSIESSARIKISQLPEKEYDFVEEPSQDYLCPVTLELLRDPQQTTCCGHHLSLEAATRLQQGGKPCPMCKEPNFTTLPDKFFKRKVNELKVRCPNRRSRCAWVGDLGSMDQHANSCPKRPWQCDFCGFKSTYIVGTKTHLPVCVKYPEPCPNQCDIGTIPRCDVQKHLIECPLQLVECEFAKAGCQERVIRRDLARHVEEGAQHHLLKVSLLNLTLTRELHQQIAELQKQNKELQSQNKELQRQNEELQSQNKELQGQNKQLQGQLQQQGVGLQSKLHLQEKLVDNQFRETKAMLTNLDQKITANGQKVAAFQTELECQERRMKRQLEQHTKELQDQVPKQHVHDETQLQGHQDLVITTYSVRKRKPNVVVHGQPHYHECMSEPFCVRNYKFKFNIDIFQNGNIRGYLFPLSSGHDQSLQWPIQCTAQLLLLNQLGNHGHRLAAIDTQLNKADRLGIPIKDPFAKGCDVERDFDRSVQYLKGDSLHFRLYLSVYI